MKETMQELSEDQKKVLQFITDKVNDRKGKHDPYHVLDYELMTRFGLKAKEVANRLVQRGLLITGDTLNYEYFLPIHEAFEYNHYHDDSGLFHIVGFGKKYNAGYDVERVQKIVDKLNNTLRPDIKEQDNQLWIFVNIEGDKYEWICVVKKCK